VYLTVTAAFMGFLSWDRFILIKGLKLRALQPRNAKCEEEERKVSSSE
jgi:hypothetical protein